MEYAILDVNMERLEKKLLTIKNKCKKAHCPFKYKVLREEYRTITNSSFKDEKAKFYIVDVDGTAIINGWEFIASIERLDNDTNLIKKVVDVEIPKKYYNIEPSCDHCNTHRYRKYTYLIRNTETGEFKQVGHNCLEEYTHGMSANLVAQYISSYDMLIKGEQPINGCGDIYYDLKRLLSYVVECTIHFGFVKNVYPHSTAKRVMTYYLASRGEGMYVEEAIKEMKETNFNPEREEVVKVVDDILKWLKDKKETNDYMHNVKSLCASEYIRLKDIPYISPLYSMYRTDLEKAKQHEEYLKQREGEKTSEYIGNVGDKVEVELKNFVCVHSYPTNYGWSCIYKMTDIQNNVLIWTTSKTFNTEDIHHIKGIIKEQREYNGIKETILTRCKVA